MKNLINSNIIKRIILFGILFFIFFNELQFAQFKLGSGNFWIYSKEYNDFKIEMTGEILTIDSIDYYNYTSKYTSNTQSWGIQNSKTFVIDEQYKPKYYIGKLNNGLFEELKILSDNTRDYSPYIYKENAKLGDRWAHRIIYDSEDSTNVDTLWAEVSAVFDGIVFNEINEVKQIHYLTGFDYYRYFCEDYGELSETTIGGEVRSSLKGCYIDGVPYGDTSYTVVGVNQNNLAEYKFELFQNYPNPFNPSTTIKYSIKDKGLVKLTVFNSLGEEINELVNEIQEKGNYSVKFNANKLSSGVYFYRITVNNYVSVKKMLLTK